MRCGLSLFATWKELQLCASANAKAGLPYTSPLIMSDRSFRASLQGRSESMWEAFKAHRKSQNIITVAWRGNEDRMHAD